MNLRCVLVSLSVLGLLSCDGVGPGGPGQDGQQGQQGSQGTQGPQGPPGAAGMNGRDATGTPDKVGTRLKRYSSVLSADDGTQVTTPSGLYRDTMLNMDCNFQMAADGKQRCLPSTTSGDVVVAYSASVFYSDSGCSRKLYYIAKLCTSGRYLFLGSTSATCPLSTQFAVYSKPSPVTPTALYVGSPGSCSPISDISSYLLSYAFFDLSGVMPISPTQFVGSTTTQVL